MYAIRSYYDNHAREVSLGDQVGIANQAAARFSQGIGKELPGKHGSINHDGIWGTALRRKIGDLAENQGEHKHGQQGTKHCPDDPDHRLLISYEDIAPNKEIEQLPVEPQITSYNFV